MSATVPKADIDLAFVKIKTTLRNLTTHTNLVKAKIEGCAGILKAITDKATDIATAESTQENLMSLIYFNTQLSEKLRALKLLKNSLEDFDDKLEALIE